MMNTQAAQEPEAQHSTGEIKKIFVAVDYLAKTPEIFEQAKLIARMQGSQLMIFHCIQGIVTDIVATLGRGTYGGIYSHEMLELEKQLEQETTEELKSWLDSFVQEAIKAGIIAEYDYQVGNPGQTICMAAKNWGADLIVIGRRGRKGLSEILLGSVSNYIIHHAHCSVLVVQNRQ
jgi:nucleotide-binding universal stress UspA family protein